MASPVGSEHNNTMDRDLPLSPESRKANKTMAVEIHFLDGSSNTFHVQSKSMGQVLFNQVCKMLNLLEVDYFGLEYSDNKGTKYWLDYQKSLGRQLGLSTSTPTMNFCVKFYTPDPAQLEEEYTRYLFSLQIKRDLSQGLLQCNDNTAALMASYIVQAECGDFVAEDYPDPSYLSSYRFVPYQDAELQRKIMENHKKHMGQTPAEADLNLLETARRCELYGIKMTPAKDNEGVPLNLAVAHMGVLVFQNFTKINTFSWAKIRKLSFKRKRFFIKLHPEGYGYYKDTVEFFFEGRNEAKNFWKKCIENHGFFRCTEVKKVPRQKPRIFSRGSSFRYSGRTQKQIVEYVRENYVKRQPFQRSTSLRVSSSSRSGVGTMGTSLSAQPLLPVSSSQSCGSVALSGECMDSLPPKQASLSEPTTPHIGQDVGHSVANGSVLREGDDTAVSSKDIPDLVHHITHITPNKTVERSSAPSLTSPSSPSMSVSSNISCLTVTSLNSPDNSISAPISSSELGTRLVHKRTPTDKAYFMAKELLMTERTYRKDLEILNVYFRDETCRHNNMPRNVLEQLFLLMDPLYECHCSMLRELEQRLALWSGRPGPSGLPVVEGIGDILLNHFGVVQHYHHYLEEMPKVLEQVSSAFSNNQYFQQVFRDFEQHKICYLPLLTFLLRPAYRLTHYCFLLKNLINQYGAMHPDYKNCKDALLKYTEALSNHDDIGNSLGNYVKLMELQRDILGIDNIQQPGRQFIREGFLLKVSRKGNQQRMFFMFSDILLYTSRAPTPTLQFKVHGQLPLADLTVQDVDANSGSNNYFTISRGNRSLLLAASSEEEKSLWISDITQSIKMATNSTDKRPVYTSQHSSGSVSLDERSEAGDDQEKEQSHSESEKMQHRANTTIHVCWHRNISVGRENLRLAMQNYLSGYLLRKFKNSNGWQKLWVVFSNFCLFFYKSYLDDFPLASLPLLGYRVDTSDTQDNINKDFVFKLQYKSHMYFFQADSRYTFSRWLDVISTATLSREEKKQID